jgi:hypothetical protein
MCICGEVHGAHYAALLGFCPEVAMIDEAKPYRVAEKASAQSKRPRVVERVIEAVAALALVLALLYLSI